MIKKWSKTQEQVKNASTNFNKFALLLMENFSECSNMFGSIQENENSFQLHHTQAEILNIIKYGTCDVFVYAEQIILNYRRSFLKYCIYHHEMIGTETEMSYLVVNHHDTFITSCMSLFTVNFTLLLNLVL
jgi:hypothetical protein